MGLLSKEKEAEASSYSNNDSNAPPPYTSVPAPSSSTPSQQHHQHGASPFDGSSAPTPRTFHIYHHGLSGRKQTVMENDKTTKAYDVERHSMSKPHIRITSGGATGHEVGAVNFHFFSRTLDLVVNGSPVQLDPAGWFTRSFTFMSSIGKLKWEYISMWGKTMACVTENGEWLARFDWSVWAMKKDGKLDIVNTQLPQGLVDELVVSGLAMVEVERRRRNNAAASGSSASGVS